MCIRRMQNSMLLHVNKVMREAQYVIRVQIYVVSVPLILVQASLNFKSGTLTITHCSKEIKLSTEKIFG